MRREEYLVPQRRIFVGEILIAQAPEGRGSGRSVTGCG
jgi:hypothetical protein